jgi:hypothetical protein
MFDHLLRLKIANDCEAVHTCRAKSPTCRIDFGSPVTPRERCLPNSTPMIAVRVGIMGNRAAKDRRLCRGGPVLTGEAECRCSQAFQRGPLYPPYVIYYHKFANIRTIQCTLAIGSNGIFNARRVLSVIIESAAVLGS